MYQFLSADFYDLFFNDTLIDESFYRFFIDRQGGKSLEVGCGTGRLLLRYRAQGLDVEGVDSSAAMLEQCRCKALSLSLTPIVLYEQAMQNLVLPTCYQTIFIPFCAFMLVPREEAIQALQRLYAHLIPGGQILISLSLPWRELEGYQPGTWRLKQFKKLPDGALALCHEACTFGPWSQSQNCLFRYELIKDGILQAQSVEDLTVHWYGRDEMTMLLKQAGFKVQTWYGDYTFEPAADYHEVLVVHATR